ncbi:MAG: LuxR C-terminal-related transcriptional regulator, partial [Bacteroidales bacterium]
VLPLSENLIVIGTMKEGLYLWDMQSVTAWEVPANQILKNANIFCAATYEDRYLVFGTIQSGMVITDLSGRLVFQIGKDKGLNNNTVLSLFVDRDGNIWGGLDNGIVKVNLRSSITFLQGYYDLGTGYVIERNFGKWYFGTNQGLFTIKDETFASPLKDRDDFIKVDGTDGQVWSLYKTGNTMLCGHNLGVFEVGEHGAEMISPSTVNGVWLFRKVPGRDNMLVAGTYDGLILLEKENDKWKYKSRVKDFSESSRYIEWDSEGNLWVSHGYKGLFKLVFDNDYSVISDIDTFSIEEFPDLGPSPVISKVDGELLVSGAGGIYSVSEQDSIKRYRGLDNYFAGDYPDRLIQDRFQNIWYFRDVRSGVLRAMEDGTYKNINYPFISLENKLVSSFESVFVIDRDNILFGIEDGFAHYSVYDGLEFDKPFKVHIRSFKGRPDTVAYVMNQNGRVNMQSRVPEYPFRDNLFEIQYAATYFREGKVEYSTYLSDYDLEAGSWSSNTSRQFAKLPEGDYEFVVKARNSFGVQSEPVVFRFSIAPPWYRTLFAKIVYILMTFMAIVLIINIFYRRLEISRQKEKLRQQQSYKAREEKLNNEALKVEKELIRMRNERLRSEMVFKEKELANSTMNILQKNESLRGIKNSMIKIKSLQDITEVKNQIARLVRKIDRDIDSEDYWKVFEVHLEQVHEAFLKRLSEKHPGLTSRERRLCAYIRMGMTSKEIAALVNISYRAVENNRYRLRQKLNLEAGANLSQYIASL